jgi:hypothetical protein
MQKENIKRNITIHQIWPKPEKILSGKFLIEIVSSNQNEKWSNRMVAQDNKQLAIPIILFLQIVVV